MESTALTAEQEGPRLQQVTLCSNATAPNTETEKNCLPQEGLKEAKGFRERP